MNDPDKLEIVEQLLKFRNDTSLCCMDVVSRSFNGIEGYRGKPKNVNRFTVQIDALFMINRICWPKTMEFYSCTPVLLDKKTGKDINFNYAKLDIVFAAYLEWYERIKDRGKISGYFPFNDGRYAWYGGRKSVVRE